MSIFNDKTNKNVADAAAKIMQQMAEGTKPKTEKEKDLAALGHPKDKITHKDVLIGRGVLKKEETEEDEIDEAMSHQAKTTMKHIKNPTPGEMKAAGDIKRGVAGYRDRIAMLHSAKARGALKEEETEELDEGWKEMMSDVKERERSKGTGNFEKKKISTGTVYSRKPPKDNEPAEPDQPKRGRGRPRKKFSEMIELISDEGIRSLNEALELVEEPDNEQYTKEVERQKRKDAGTAAESEKAKVAKAEVMAVQNEEYEELDERTLTEPEKAEKERLVKSMKKGLSGFKERYGERAKSVMYATATKRAKENK